MKRLTHQRSNGIKTGYWSPAKKQELIDALAEWEDFDVTPDQMGYLWDHFLTPNMVKEAKKEA